MFSKNLKYLREKNDMEQLDLALTLGKKSSSTISEWEKGLYKPKIGVLNSIANFFNVDLDDLMNKDLSVIENEVTTYQKIVTIVNHLNEDYQDKVLSFVEQQKLEQDGLFTKFKKSVPVYPVKVTEALAAGVGYAYGDNETSVMYTDREDLPQYDLASLVTGDSMYPLYKNGDVVLIRGGYDYEPGAIYAIDYDGKSFLKKVYYDYRGCRLVSINPIYPDIFIQLPTDEWFNILGKVVDSFTPVDA